MVEISLAMLKKEYEKLRVKYNLPEYKLINEEFDIEKLQDHETETLLREIRKIMMDKVIAYLRFIEMLLNPANAPMFFFGLLKQLETADRKVLEETYAKLGKLEVEVINVDNDYSEAKEAGFILHLSDEWKLVKKNMGKISRFLIQAWEKKTGEKDRGYLG